MGYKNRKIALALLLGYIVILYSMIPLVRPVTNYLRESNYLTISIIALAIVIVLPLAFIYFRSFKFSAKNIGFLFFMLCLYYLGIQYASSVEEKVHLLQYGLLALLSYKFFGTFGFMSSTLFLVSLLFCSLIGWGDEVIQYYIPERYFDWRDVILNAYSSLLGLFLVSNKW